MSTLSVDTIQGQTTAANVKLPAGSILQTVVANATNQVNISSASYIDGDVTATITPKYNNSKILVISQLSWDNPSDGVFGARLLRDSTVIDEETYWGYCSAAVAGGGVSYTVSRNAHYHIDSPATTSSTVYKWQVRRQSGSSTGYINYDDGNGECDSQLILQEIAQ